MVTITVNGYMSFLTYYNLAVVLLSWDIFTRSNSGIWLGASTMKEAGLWHAISATRIITRLGMSIWE